MKFSELSKEDQQEIINDYKQLIEEFTHEKFSKIPDNSSTLSIHYYGNNNKEDYSFYLNENYLIFQNYFTHFDTWLNDIFSIALYDDELHILTKTENRTSMFKILNTQIGK